MGPVAHTSAPCALQWTVETTQLPFDLVALLEPLPVFLIRIESNREYPGTVIDGGRQSLLAANLPDKASLNLGSDHLKTLLGLRHLQREACYAQSLLP